METLGHPEARDRPHPRLFRGIWFEIRDASRTYLFEFIEVIYNRQRHQGGLAASPQPSTPPASVNVHNPVSRIRGQLQTTSATANERR